MSCDICQPKAKGYTVYFSNEENLQQIRVYFQDFSNQEWKLLNKQMFWVIEPLFFDLIDYVELHIRRESVFAVETHVLNPITDVDRMKPIHLYKKEREASWIDRLIETRSICTYYQPIVAFNNGKLKIVGYELLSRGMDANGEIISPFKMFEAARVRNRVFALDRACRLECVRNAAVVGDKLIFINFIPTAIYVPEHCLSTTFELIKEMKIKPEQVVFEVVETDEVKDLNHLKSILNYYRSHGFKYALDDVGVGFNDFNKLSQMKPNVVKLAIDYTNGVHADRTKQEVAKSILEISHEMGAIALAEGVERKEDFIYLREMGYDLFQGYYFSKPSAELVDNIELVLN